MKEPLTGVFDENGEWHPSEEQKEEFNDAVLLQHVSQNSEHVNLLKITAARTLEYCQMHKMDFYLMVSGEIPYFGDWSKVRIIRQLMNIPNYKYIIYIDADALIVDMDHDLRQACVEGKVGACRHDLKPPHYMQTLNHLNVGCLYVHNNQNSRDFMDKWLEGYPGTSDPCWWEQGVLNNIMTPETVAEVDAKYNATGYANPCKHPVVKGYHGMGNVKVRFNMMLKDMGK